jgi:hypothetical protein
MSRCARCGADVARGRKTCPRCGLRAGVLPSNEADPRLRRRRVTQGQLVGWLRLAIVLAITAGVVALMLQHQGVVASGVRPALDSLAQTGLLLLQAAAQQVALRSRTPAVAGAVDIGRLAVLVVFVSGLFWFARTRMR